MKINFFSSRFVRILAKTAKHCREFLQCRMLIGIYMEGNGFLKILIDGGNRLDKVGFF